MLSETRLGAADLIWPVFIKEGQGLREDIPSMPNVARMSLDVLGEEIAALLPLGLKAVALFPVIPDSQKNSKASEALNDKGFLPEAVRTLKKNFPDLVLICDVALDPYSSDGHDGLVKDGQVLNDESLEVLSQMALVQARAGADIVAPSDMMDGRVGHIRKSLDESGFKDVAILAYTAKYASSFYGPFREALSSAPRFGDKKTYQMNPSNAREALLELELDLQEGADMVMVKPALAYLDIIYRLKEKSTVPVVAYQVSGEYAQIEASAKAGFVDRKQAIYESLTSIKRAGADVILSYYTPEILRDL